MNKNIFIGGAWPYSNYYMHIGHLAALLPGDILARYYRTNGDHVIYVSGSDCHGTPITQRAKKEGKQPSEIASFYHNAFDADFKALNFSYDEYSNTMDPYHIKNVQEFIETINQKGYLYPQSTSQEYCPKCNTFLSDREIVGECKFCGGVAEGDQCKSCLRSLTPNDIVKKVCATCGTPVEIKENTHLYFKLSEFQELLSKYVQSNKEDWRTNAYNESEKYLNMGLIDRAITRQINWGIQMPSSIVGFEDKRVYVWFEAVMGYITMAKKVAERTGVNFEDFFTSNNLTTIYAHGKDNIPFHTIIFPALITAINDKWQLPKQIISCEYFTVNGEKMSKSTGNLYTIRELLYLFAPDTVRFYTTFNAPEKKDSNFTLAEVVQQHNKFLVGVIGNFVNRNISYINKKFGGVFKEGVVDPEIVEFTKNTYSEFNQLMHLGETKAAITLVVDYATNANKYYDTKQPWVLAHENETEFYNVSYTCAYIIANLANLLYPFIPQSAGKISSVLFKEFVPTTSPVSINGDFKVLNTDLLFTRIDEKEMYEKYENYKPQ